MIKGYAKEKSGNIKHVGRIGFISTLAVGMMLSLAACGTSADSTGRLAATAVVPAAATATGTGPGTGTGTGTTDTMGMTEGSMASTSTPPIANSDSSTEATPEAQSEQGGGSSVAAIEVGATLKEWALDLSQTEVPAGRVRFVVVNAGQFSHNLTVTDSSGQIAKTPNFRAGDGQQILEVDLKPGTYSIICDIPGHASRGQKNELVVK